MGEYKHFPAQSTADQQLACSETQVCSQKSDYWWLPSISVIPYISGVCTCFRIYVRKPKPPPGTVRVSNQRTIKDSIFLEPETAGTRLVHCRVSTGEAV